MTGPGQAHAGPGVRDTQTWARRLTIWPFVALIWLYRVTLSPLMGGHCRFHPTCSVYALDAYRTHGVLRGSYLTVRRLLRCHPFGGSGFDPVPEARSNHATSQTNARE